MGEKEERGYTKKDEGKHSAKTYDVGGGKMWSAELGIDRCRRKDIICIVGK